MENSAARLWKRLPVAERLAAASHFWQETPPAMVPGAVTAIVGARHVRPQAVRAWAPEERARALAQVLDLGEALAASLLVALHIGARREMLTTFLDAAGVAHEEGVLKDEGGGSLSTDAARAGIAALRARWPEPQVALYLNTLWLQDPERWGALEEAAGG